MVCFADTTRACFQRSVRWHQIDADIPDQEKEGQGEELGRNIWRPLAIKYSFLSFFFWYLWKSRQLLTGLVHVSTRHFICRWNKLESLTWSICNLMGGIMPMCTQCMSTGRVSLAGKDSEFFFLFFSFSFLRFISNISDLKSGPPRQSSSCWMCSVL